MEKDKFCVFCGQKLGVFRNATIQCGGTRQPFCKACEKELGELDEAELCRRALILGIAEHPEQLKERIDLITEAEHHRPKCLRCGGSLSFMEMQELDNSPMGDGIFAETFDVLPAYCTSCGKYEFYHPSIVRKNKYLAHLILKDTEE